MSVARIPFRAEEEGVISQLGIWMLVIAILHFFGGALFLLAGCFGMIGGAAQVGGAGAAGIFGLASALFILLFAIALIGQGIVLVMSRGAFNKVVKTDEADQRYLSEGFRWLKLFFFVEIAVGILSMVQAITDVMAVAVAGPMGGGL